MKSPTILLLISFLFSIQGLWINADHFTFDRPAEIHEHELGKVNCIPGAELHRPVIKKIQKVSGAALLFAVSPHLPAHVTVPALLRESSFLVSHQHLFSPDARGPPSFLRS